MVSPTLAFTVLGESVHWVSLCAVDRKRPIQPSVCYLQTVCPPGPTVMVITAADAVAARRKGVSMFECILSYCLTELAKV